MFTIIESMALLDGGSIYLSLQDDEGNAFSIRLDKAFDSPTRGMFFASMINGALPLTNDQHPALINLLKGINTDDEYHQSHVNILLSQLNKSLG